MRLFSAVNRILSSNKLTFFLVLILIFLGLALLGITMYKHTDLFEKSQAEIFVEDTKVKVRFEINEDDKEKFNRFFQNLGGQSNLLEGISLSLDQDSIKRLENILPIRVNMVASEKEINFYSGGLSSLNYSPLAGDEIKIATGGGQLLFRSKSDRDFLLEIKQPKSLIEEATASGKIKTSSLVNSLFPIIGKVDTISLRVNGRSMEGYIKIKD